MLTLVMFSAHPERVVFLGGRGGVFFLGGRSFGSDEN